MVNQFSLIAQMALVAKKEKQKYNKQTKKNKEKNQQIKNGNHYPKNGQEGDLEFSTR